MDEKRQYPRLSLKYPVFYHLPKSGDSCFSVLNDLSIGGLKLVTEDLLAVNDTVDFKIMIGDDVIDGKGKVVWNEYSPFVENRRAGVEFIEMKSQSKAVLSHFLYSN